jgi:membrane protein CcdC involved in cytochrome C biogenesis
MVFFCCQTARKPLRCPQYKRAPLSFSKNRQEVFRLKKKNPPERQKLKKPINYGRILYMAFLMFTMTAMFVQPAFAATTMWEKANEIMQDVYNQILLISTIAAIVTASVALLLMNFSRSGRTVDESRAWLKRIVITWVILNGLGFIMAYITPFFSGGQWNG